MHSYRDRPTESQGEYHGEPQARQPRSEPEIIPPGVDIPRRRYAEGSVFTQHGARIHVTKLGPFGIAMALLATGALAVAGLFFLLGAVVIGAAAAGAVIVGATVSRLLRGPGQ
jgi:hypothetical protein